MAADMMRLQQAFQGEMKKLQEVTQQLGKLVGPRSKRQSEFTENRMVLEELERLGEEASVYKLVGPVLIKQDIVEAKDNVQRRIDFIKTDMKRIEDKTKQHQKEQEELKKKMMQIQEIVMKAQQKMKENAQAQQ